jgi:hypothetical protein
VEPSNRSPRITQLSWGRIEIEGHGVLKDAKLFPGGAREWDWGESGTGHSQGIQPADVDELLEHGATEVVLGTGVYGRLRVSPKSVELLESRGIALHRLRTNKAVELYNELRERKPVGGLFHTTC